MKKYLISWMAFALRTIAVQLCSFVVVLILCLLSLPFMSAMRIGRENASVFGEVIGALDTFFMIYVAPFIVMQLLLRRPDIYPKG